jgi:hypothetical protein
LFVKAYKTDDQNMTTTTEESTQIRNRTFPCFLPGMFV